MKHEELDNLASNLSGDFRTIEPRLRDLDKHLTLRTYLEGYTLGDLEKKIWQTLRGNKVAIGFIRRNGLPNLTRWFTFLEQTHPELQEDATKGKAIANKGGANYNLALQDADKGVVTRFLPEPSYVDINFNPYVETMLILLQWLFTHRTRQSGSSQRLLRSCCLQGPNASPTRRH